MISQYEIARILGLRSLQLSQVALSLVTVKEDHLCSNYTYIAALELATGVLDVCVRRQDGSLANVRDETLHPNLFIFLDTCDGGDSSYTSTRRSKLCRKPP